MPIDLPYALRLVNAANPTIALAQERVREANAVLKQAQVMWLPNIWMGGNPYAPTVLSTFYHHDGFIQNANGLVFYTDKNSFFVGSGVGMVLPFADAVFAPKIARAGREAAAARAQAVRNDVQLDVALAYQNTGFLGGVSSASVDLAHGLNMFGASSPDSPQLSRTGGRADFTKLEAIPARGIIVTAYSADRQFDFVSRFFAPSVGVNEDPVCGSAHCCLGPFWSTRLRKTELLGHQISARGGIIGVRVRGERVVLCGTAVTVLEGRLDA